MINRGPSSTDELRREGQPTNRDADAGSSSASTRETRKGGAGSNPAVSIPPVPPEYEAIAARLERHAHAIRELGRYGAAALGESESVYDALWAISDALVDEERDIDAIAERLANEADRALDAREGIGP